MDAGEPGSVPQLPAGGQDPVRGHPNRDHPYDVVADMCATINYVRDRYHVNLSGSNFAARVQQADPHRRPHGY
ncbi:hypothetical protein [Streptomyces sp. NPDC040750]|uniref:hypothetical protein n=1 Tax=Streptomyces sp. NPDC040750 TaxID=3154491 RepID=UPI0033C92819